MSKSPACATCGDALIHPSRGRRRRYCSRSCQARAYRARRDRSVPTARPRPTRLTAVGIARTAVELTDREGIDGLTMRRLASELGVATAALYRHFPDREALLGAMAELVLAESPPPAAAADWRAALTHEAEQEWQLYQRHPWMLPVLARSTPPVGPALLDILERSFAALDGIGLSRDDALAVYLAYSGLIQGLALLWCSDRGGRLTGAQPPADTEAARADLIDLILARPVLRKLFGASPPGPELDFDELVREGVGLLLDGVAMRLPEQTE
ncbi:TetR/AcrR family transcriptional regulator [Nocardia lijiangensis]|uniref:TetR/AcrR family transcriptional regulator n=1 Tax=Nocardia lijiangensis TaxID=299618 RepID=UPI000832BA86|nr:TetR/AcrR family transcriptional regulator [Nocardia lijiangensis]